MSETIAERNRCWFLWMNEILFSLNLAWLVIWHERMSSSSRLYSLPLVRYLYLHTHFVEPETVIVQVCWSLLAGGLLFLFLRVLSQLRTTGKILGSIGGIIALAGFPFLAVLFPFAFFSPIRIRDYSLWLLLETFAAVFCGVLYYLRKWPLPTSLTVALLFLHFILWAWVTGTWVSPLREIHVYGPGGLGIWISTFFYFGFPALGLLSSLAWANRLKCYPRPIAV